MLSGLHLQRLLKMYTDLNRTEIVINIGSRNGRSKRRHSHDGDAVFGMKGSENSASDRFKWKLAMGFLAGKCHYIEHTKGAANA